MSPVAATYFKPRNGTLDEDIDQSVDDYASAITENHPNLNAIGACVAIGEGFRVFIGLVNEDASTALSNAMKLSDKDWHTSTARGLAILFRHHGVTEAGALRGKVGHLEGVMDRLLHPGGVESDDEDDEDGGTS